MRYKRVAEVGGGFSAADHKKEEEEEGLNSGFSKNEINSRLEDQDITNLIRLLLFSTMFRNHR